MTNLAIELRTVLLTRLRECEAFSNGVAGRIADQERNDYPFAWVAVTQSAERPELLATVHVWIREGQAAAAQLVQTALAALRDAPSIENASITSWSPCHSEVRYDNNHEAQHGIARFSAEIVDRTGPSSTPDQQPS
jgi:hypothetical protein